MDSAEWIREQQEAYADLLEDGVMFTFTRELKGAFDPVTSTYAPGGTQVFSAPGIMKMMTQREHRMALSWQQGGTIEQGDEMLLIGCGDYEPRQEDRVDINGEAWLVKACSPFRPARIPLLNYLLIRKV